MPSKVQEECVTFSNLPGEDKFPQQVDVWQHRLKCPVTHTDTLHGAVSAYMVV